MDVRTDTYRYGSIANTADILQGMLAVPVSGSRQLYRILTPRIKTEILRDSLMLQAKYDAAVPTET